MTVRMTASENSSGLLSPSRFIDPATADLNRLSRTFEDVQKMRKQHAARLATHLFGPREMTDEERQAIAAHPEVVAFTELEALYTKELQKTLKRHVLWPWLTGLKGLAGARTGRIVAAIGDPRRWPGQRCSSCGTTFPVGWFQVGDPCPLVEPPTERENRSGLGAGDADSMRESEHPHGVPVPAAREPESDLWRGVAGNADPGGESDPPLGVPVPADELRESESGRGGAGDADSRSESDHMVGAPVPAEPRSESDLRRGGAGGAEVNIESAGADGVSCPGHILPPRPGTGSRSVWHYFGLMPGSDGRLIRRRKGVQASYSPQLRALVLGDMGIADQIVRHRTQPYRRIYDETKGVPALEAYPPWRANKIARTVTAKAFLADLLAEWKRLVGEGSA